MSDTLTDTIIPFFDNVDLTSFKDASFKKKFIDDIAEKTENNKNSIRITVGQILKQKLKDEGIDSAPFVNPKKKRYSSNLDVNPDTKPVDIKDEKKPKDNESKNFPDSKNPNGKLATERKELPMGAIAGSMNSFLGAIFEDLEELTTSEKEDVGACLNMAFGDYIQGHDNARKVFGAFGILGVYGGKIKTARSHKKKRLEEEKPKEKVPEVTEQDRDEFFKRSQEFIEDKMKSDT